MPAGSLTYSRLQRFLNKYSVGTEASFTCDSGFLLFGSRQRTCETTGEWDGEPTVCAGSESFCSFHSVGENQKCQLFISTLRTEKNMMLSNTNAYITFFSSNKI